MKDHSVFEGNFEQQIINGKYVHFTGMTFEGKFCRERFKRGTITFIDGDVLKGEWGNTRGRWILKKGVLMEGEKVICEFNKTNKFAKIKLKEIYCDDEDQGFCVRYDY